MKSAYVKAPFQFEVRMLPCARSPRTKSLFASRRAASAARI